MKWRTGGEPDVVGYDKKTGEYIFMIVQRKVLRPQKCLYDREALEQGKIQPKDSAMNMAAAMGIELLTEEQYRGAETWNFDTKTSSG
jgi:hypothetical protein